MNERWWPIADTNGAYSISSKGNVKNNRTGFILNNKTKGGVKVRINDKSTYLNLQSLVKTNGTQNIKKYRTHNYKEIERLYNSGMNCNEVSEELNIPKSTVQKIVRKLGIVRSRAGHCITTKKYDVSNKDLWKKIDVIDTPYFVNKNEIIVNRDGYEVKGTDRGTFTSIKLGGKNFSKKKLYDYVWKDKQIALHRRRDYITDNEKNKLIELCALGQTNAKIAKMIGRSECTIRRYRKKLGIKRSDEIIKDLIVLDYKNGNSIRDIVKKYRTSKSAVLSKLSEEKIHIDEDRELYKRECKFCGSKFTTNYQRQVFCSKKCSRGYKLSKQFNYSKYIQIKKGIALHQIAKRDNNVCYLCGEKVDFDDYEVINGYKVLGDSYPTRDHVIPRAKGGDDSPENLKLCWRKCNSYKRDLDLSEVVNYG